MLTQCKESKNHEERLDEMLTRIHSLEKNINYLMEHKNFMKQSQVLIAILTKQKRISEIEDQLSETKWEGKIDKKE